MEFSRLNHHETLAQVGRVGKCLHQGQPCGANEVTPLVFGSLPGRQARHHGDTYPSQPPEAQRHVDEKGRGLIAPLPNQVRVIVLIIGWIVSTAGESVQLKHIHPGGLTMPLGGHPKTEVLEKYGGLSIAQAKAVNLVPCACWNAGRLASDELRYPLD